MSYYFIIIYLFSNCIESCSYILCIFFFTDSSLHESLTNIEDEVETARSSRRRERKMKFDLKSVLNIRTTPPPTPPPSQLNIEKTSQTSKAKSDLKLLEQLTTNLN